MERKNKQRYKFYILGIVLLGFLILLPIVQLKPAGAQSQNLNGVSGEPDLDLKIRTFFETLMKGNSATAFEELLRQSHLNSFDGTQASTELRNKVDELQTQFGEILDHEKYDTKRIGTDVVVIRSVLKYERHPVLWTFTFYRKPSVLTASITSTSNPWVVVEVNFDTDMKRLL